MQTEKSLQHETDMQEKKYRDEALSIQAKELERDINADTGAYNQILDKAQRGNFAGEKPAVLSRSSMRAARLTR